MYFKKIEDESGPYADAHGRRYDVAGARRVRSSSMEYSNYEELESLEEALQTWGLCACELPPPVSEEAN